MQDAEQEVKINGVGGHQFTVTQTGYLDPLFRVYASEDTHANILSLSEVEDRYAVTYVPQKCFIVNLLGHDMEFVRKDGMYTRSSAESYPGMCVGEKIFLFVCLFVCIFVCLCVCSMEEDVAFYVV